VKDGTTTLELGTDYTVSYSNNYNARQASATNAPTATVTGKGNYSGTASKTFTISKAKSSLKFSTNEYVKTFGDADFTITPSITGDGKLTYKSDNEKVATVDKSSGQVHILDTGKVRIIASLTYTKNYTSASGWYEVTVNPKQTTITIGANEMVTYCGTDPLDFTGN
jgi:uncharacterized protein YjdB